MAGPTGRLEYSSRIEERNGRIIRDESISVYGRTEQDVQQILADVPNVVRAIEKARNMPSPSSYLPAIPYISSSSLRYLK